MVGPLLIDVLGGTEHLLAGGAAVDVYPEADDSIKIDIPEKDLEMKFIRGGGAGGQKINKTASLSRGPGFSFRIRRNTLASRSGR